MQISLRTQAPSKISPSKRAFEKYKPGGLFSEFYSISHDWGKKKADMVENETLLLFTILKDC